MSDFDIEVRERVAQNAQNKGLTDSAKNFMAQATEPKYCYNFSFLGRPIIQYPQDMVTIQELIWEVQPDLIVETGIAHGGSLIMSAGLLELNAACGGNPNAEVLGIDIDIREHNRKAIEAHPMFKRISMIEGSSTAQNVIDQVHQKAKGKDRVMVFLDSMHSHDHVLAELEAYAGLTSVGSYCVVFDTIIEDLPQGQYSDRPWDVGDNAKTAMQQWLKDNQDFQVDKARSEKILISACPDGFLKRTS